MEHEYIRGTLGNEYIGGTLGPRGHGWGHGATTSFRAGIGSATLIHVRWELQMASHFGEKRTKFYLEVTSLQSRFQNEVL